MIRIAITVAAYHAIRSTLRLLASVAGPSS
jgi:hypothetical protein